MRAQIAASSGQFALNREIPVCAGLLQPNDYQPPALSIEHSARLAKARATTPPGKSMRRALVHSCLGNNRLARSSKSSQPSRTEIFLPFAETPQISAVVCDRVLTH